MVASLSAHLGDRDDVYCWFGHSMVNPHAVITEMSAAWDT